jgi:hypothetical protein
MLFRGRRSYAAGVAAPCAAAITLLLAGGYRFAAGFCIAANDVSETFGRRFGRIFPLLNVDAPQAEQKLCLDLFLAVAAILVACAAVYTVRSAGPAPCLILLCCHAVTLSVFGDGNGMWVAIACFAVFAVILVFGLFVRVGGRRFKTARRISSLDVLAALSCVIALSSVVSLAAVYLPENDAAAGARLRVLASLDGLRYGESSAALPHGDFTALGDRETQPGKTRIEVSMSEPDSLWLRGFVGDRYNGHGWSPIPAGELYDSAELFSRLHASGFYGQTQLASAAAASDAPDEGGDEIRVTVNNVGESGKYIFAPYELSAADGELMNANGIGDEKLRSNGFKGNKFYGYESSRNIVKQYPQIALRMAEASPYANGVTGGGERDSGAGEGYRIDESHYRSFVYDSYTDLPERTYSLLARYLGPYDESGRPSYSSVKQQILSFLSESGAVYSDEILQQGEGGGTSPNTESGDFLQAFIEKNKRGYDVHYATAATLIFRYYGIPARYVEGYLITPEDVNGAVADSLFMLDDTHAHAWSEFYVDGVGWAPFESAPAWIGVMEQPDDVSGSSRVEGETVGRPFDRPEELPDADAQREPLFAFSFGEHVLSPLLFIALAAAAVFLFVRLRKRRLALRGRMRLFRSEDTNEAAQALFAYALDLLTAAGLDEKNCSLFDRAEDISRASGCDVSEVLNVLSVHRKARFSRSVLSADETEAVREFQERALAKLKSTLPWRRKLKLKWVAGLY